MGRFVWVWGDMGVGILGYSGGDWFVVWGFGFDAPL